ncbi:MAG: glycosyltransferase [Verrucomicrobia bacterium]|nr:glycosyltransferase [Verrucomicrobiota bacterium]
MDWAPHYCKTGGTRMMDSVKQSPEALCMGMRVSLLTVDQLHERIAEVIEKRGKQVIPNINVNAVNIAFDEPWFFTFINSAATVFCDGHGIILGARLFGIRIPTRITYADWLPQFAQFCATRGYSIFLLGGKPGVAAKAAGVLTGFAPALMIAGWHDGYFDKGAGTQDNRQVVDEINRSRCNILLVCFGMPMQERWLMENLPALSTNVMLTGGAALDYISGSLRRPPAWMTRHGFEWLGRLLIEPGRLWKRYLVGNSVFLIRLILARLGVLPRHMNTG